MTAAAAAPKKAATGGVVTFPYKTLEAAEKDHFKKLGGPERAFQYLVKGFKATAWRKRTEAKARELERAEAEHVRD